MREVAALDHEAACHLTAEDRIRLWAELSAGDIPAEAREISETDAEASSAGSGAAQAGSAEPDQPVTHDGVEA